MFSRISYAAIAVVISFATLAAPVGAAGTFDVTGSIDCGRVSGATCADGDLVTIVSSDGTFIIDISWLKSGVPDNNQDAQLQFEVEASPDGHFQALRVVAPDQIKEKAGEDDVRNDHDEEEDRCGCLSLNVL
jgi:hypothetical protein